MLKQPVALLDIAAGFAASESTFSLLLKYFCFLATSNLCFHDHTKRFDQCLQGHNVWVGTGSEFREFSQTDA